MVRSTRRVSAASFGALVVLTLASLPMLGHVEGAVIQLSHETIQPGATVTVHGQGMNPDEEISFELGDAVRALPLGTSLAAGDGSLAASLEIPWQTPKGSWTVYARGTDGDVVSAPLVLAGVALDPQEGQGEPPDEEDPLISLEPTLTAEVSAAPGATASPRASAVAAAADATFRARTLPPQPGDAPAAQAGSPSPPGPALWLVAASGGVALISLTVVALALRRRSPHSR